MEEQSGEPGWVRRNLRWLVIAPLCVAIAAISLVVVIGFYLPMRAVQVSEVCRLALEKVAADPKAAEALGVPLRLGWRASGSIGDEGSRGYAELTLPVSGTKRSGTIYANAIKSDMVAGLDRWKFTTLEVAVEGTGDRIILSEMISPPPTPTPAPEIPVPTEIPGGVPGGVIGGVPGSISKSESPPPAPPPAPKPAEQTPSVVSGGILNGKAISLPKPAYPPLAREAKAQGAVVVSITIDEEGKVISAHAISGHPLLQNAAVSAARQARFAPTFLSGKPVKVTGVLAYNFRLQD